ncbi:MAG: phosphate propanoyltransferase [Chitinivibrionales bacterium]
MGPDELRTFLKEQVELFRDFPDNRLRELIEGSRVTTFEGNEAVVEFGEEGRFMGVLLSGQAEAAVTDNTGNKVRISLLEAGSIFGEMSLMTGNLTIANIIGITRCEALMIPQQLFSTVLITHPPAIRYLSRMITERTTQWATTHNLAEEALTKSDDPYGLKLKTELPAKFLIINCGSSSLKYALFDTGNEADVVRGAIERIGTPNARHTYSSAGKETAGSAPQGGGHREAFQCMMEALDSKETGCIHGAEDVTAVGHRVVHGGDRFSAPLVITDEVIGELDEVSSLAPLHNPINLLGIREAMRLFPSVPHVAVFDTGFHHSLPPYAYMYGLPYELYKQHKIRRYGFHGTSHLYVSLRASGAYVAAMQGLDVVAFTGGIGQGSAGVRSLACQGLRYMGIEIDEKKNRSVDGFSGVHDISLDASRVRVLVVPTDEERMIARETIRTISTGYITDIIRTQKNTPVPIEVSAHHVHLSARHVEELFGRGHTLTPAHELSQPGQFACTETVDLVGPKGRVERVRVLGPVRGETQVEIAMTEQFKLGIHPPIRESGDLENTPGITIEGPAGSVVLDKGVICALRHIHMSTEDALKFGLRNKCKVRVRVEGERELVFGDVLIRVDPHFRLYMHIDTDEANAASIATGAIGHIEAVQTRD